MQVRTTGAASVAQLVKELGVPDADAPKVAAQIAKAHGVDVDGPLPAGTLLTFDDALVKVAPREQRAAVVGTKLGALGLFGLQKAADGRQKDMAQNGLGALLHLSALSLPGLLDTGKLEVKAPLKAGRASLPLGE